ncbi:MAG: hypothetical protein GY922_06770, partial [Proteobacteria bacterium]|nr:hypothetical protein [Pseudomonadota bacterium]
MKYPQCVSSLLRTISGSRFVSGQLSCLKRLVLPICALGILTLTASAAQMTGELSMTKSDGEVTTTYEAGDKVYISLKDSDRNGDAGVVDEVKVLITTETENTGTKASAGAVTPGSGNPGDGTPTASKTSYDTKREDGAVTGAR